MRSTPDQVIESLSALAPFQRDKVAESYVGQSVEWKVSFHNIISISESRKDLLLFNENYQLTPAIYCHNVDLQKYPEFKLMKEKEKFSLKGKIKSIQSDTFILEDCEYFFISAEHVPTTGTIQKNSKASEPNFSIHDSPGASIIHSSSVGGNSGGNSSKSDSWIKQIIVGTLVLILAGIVLFYFNLNGNKSDLSTQESSSSLPTVLPSGS